MKMKQTNKNQPKWLFSSINCMPPHSHTAFEQCTLCAPDPILQLVMSAERWFIWCPHTWNRAELTLPREREGESATETKCGTPRAHNDTTNERNQTKFGYFWPNTRNLIFKKPTDRTWTRQCKRQAHKSLRTTNICMSVCVWRKIRRLKNYGIAFCHRLFFFRWLINFTVSARVWCMCLR